MFMKYNIVIIFLLVALFSVSCNKEKTPNKEENRRTVLVYMGGDNNLSRETYEKLDEICKGWSNNAGEMLVYQDARTPNETARLVRLVAVKGGAAQQELVAEYKDDNSASPVVFKRVIDDVIKSYPAPSYGMIIFSHSTGWMPAAGSLKSENQNGAIKSRSIINDNGKEMEISDFSNAIPDNVFDFIILEACLMGGIEPAYELRNKANYIMAAPTEIISPGFTPIYASAIKYLFEETPNLKAFAKEYFDFTSTFIDPDFKDFDPSATISIYKCANLEALIQKIKAPIMRTGGAADVTKIQTYDFAATHKYFDLGHYLSQICTPAEYTEIEALLNDCILYKAATPYFMLSKEKRFAITSYSGFSTYIPQTKLPDLNEAHKKTAYGMAVYQ